MIRLADYVANFLVDQGVRDIFMLTGYGAMYLNDAIEVSGINYYVTRNEATAPMMAESYARLKNSLGVVCVTAGPGATNAIPGLAEAFVDSASILVLSGQVDRKHTTRCANVEGLRTFGTAEIDIIPIVSPLTKFAAMVEDEKDIAFLLEKAVYMARSGRPGPVWLDIPLDVQQAIIDEKSLQHFDSPITLYSAKGKQVDEALSVLLSAKRPLIVCGQGVRQSDSINEVQQLVEALDVPVIFSRLGQDIIPHSHPNVLGHGGMKGFRKCKTIMQQADVVLSLGCRLAVQFVGHNFEAFENAKIIMVDIHDAELKKPGCKLHQPIHSDVKDFVNKLQEKLPDKLPYWDDWLNTCRKIVNQNPMVVADHKGDPIDLYYFMERLGALSDEHHVLITDAGSNYYAGGQVWRFEKGQREITSGTNAAMGTTIPLAIGASIACPESQILAVTGDGSLELNIQELKTISHYKLNIKLFVINNGGYVSMQKWQDNIFEGRRIDTEESTGVGTLDLEKIADAFSLKHYVIDKYKHVDENLLEIMHDDSPLFVEVMTTHKQQIVSMFSDET